MPAAPPDFFFESRHIEQLLLPFDHAGLDYRCEPNMHTAQDPSKMIAFYLSANRSLLYTKLVLIFTVITTCCILLLFTQNIYNLYRMTCPS